MHIPSNSELRSRFNLTLLKKRHIYIDDHVDFTIANRIEMALLYLTEKGKGKITVNINSNGGDIEAALRIYDLLTVAGKRNKVVGKVRGEVDSAALIILQGCTKRHSIQTATCKVHDIWDTTPRPFTSQEPLEQYFEKIKEAQEKNKKRFDQMHEILVYRSNSNNPEKVKDIILSDQILSAERMHQYKFIDKILGQKKKQ